IYSLNRVGGTDWFDVGSKLLLLTQNPLDGTWKSSYSVEVDTSFALLFLKRSNFAPDLTSALRTKPPGGQAALKAKADRPTEAFDAPTTAEAERLARELVAAPPDRAAKILDQLRDQKGPEYTDALARVIRGCPARCRRRPAITWPSAWRG